MSDKELREYSAAIKKYAQKLSNDKVASKEFLVEVGIITPKGNLRKPYKNLCIPQNRD